MSDPLMKDCYFYAGGDSKVLFCHWNDSRVLVAGAIDPFLCTHIVYTFDLSNKALLDENLNGGKKPITVLLQNIYSEV